MTRLRSTRFLQVPLGTRRGRGLQGYSPYWLSGGRGLPGYFSYPAAGYYAAEVYNVTLLTGYPLAEVYQVTFLTFTRGRGLQGYPPYWLSACRGLPGY